MWKWAIGAVLIGGAMLMAAPASAQIRVGGDGLTAKAGPVTLRGRFAVAAQGAVFQPTGNQQAETAGEVDGSALVTVEYEARNGVFIGVRTEVDTGNQEIGDFERDELYGYIATEYGRLEVGENDGAADLLAEHAPTVGLGQVRGDFARYTGSIALLSPFDSRDAFKVSYFSPPVAGVSLGVSYAPRFAANTDAPDPEDQTLQRNVVEAGVHYVRPVGRWVIAAAGTFVTGNAAEETNRADIRSWSVGATASRGNWSLGPAFVDRGRSNLRPTADLEREVNAGVRWAKGRWAVAASYAVTLEEDERAHRVGAGVEVDLHRNAYVRADIVGLLDQEDGDPNEFGFVALSEIGVRF